MKPKTTFKDFRQTVNRLNPEQRLAVDTIEGPVMVLAGPGTGKTQTIALRIANILTKTDADPASILALTFTDSGAQAMRKRLVKFIGEAAYRVSISTFHTFCMNVIRDNPDQFVLYSSTEPLTDLERLNIFRSIIDANNFKIIRPPNDPYHYVYSLIQDISSLKKEGIKPSDFQQSLALEESNLDQHRDELTKTKLKSRLKNLSKNKELLLVYQQYQARLKALRKFDFDDMIQFVVDRFREDQDLLLTYQERYQYFLIDEYQDTNSAQNEVVNLLASYWGKQANVFVVGDPNQSIYRFQGASFANILSFLERYPNAAIITLKDNYRSHQLILDAAHNLISHNTFNIKSILPQAESHLHAATSIPKTKIQVIEAPTSQAEILFTLDKIKQLLAQGTTPSQIAVIFRTNKEIRAFADLLTKADIKYTTQGGGNLLEDPTINKLLKIFQVVEGLVAGQESLDLFTILHYPFFQIETLDILRISRFAFENKLSLFSALDFLSHQTEPELDLINFASIKRFFAQLVFWEQHASTETLVRFFELVLNESGFLNWLLQQPDSYHYLLKLNSFFEEVKRMNQADKDLSLKQFLENLETLRQNHLPIKEAKFSFLEDAVVLTTAHSAKGLEWEYVFIPHSTDKHWSNIRVRRLFKLPSNLIKHLEITKNEQTEEERRLFYVALTRAKKQVFLTYADSYFENSRERPAFPTMFLEELGSANLTQTSLQSTQETVSQNLINLLKTSPISLQQPKPDAEKFLLSLVRQFRLSPTALNTYLSCPYKFKLNNLLRVPRAKKPHLAFGTAVHKALEQFFLRFNQDGKLPPKAYLLTSFSQALTTGELLNPQELAFRLNQGKEILSAYYDFHQHDFAPAVFLERNFSYLYFEDIPLTGKIDKIEWLDQSQRLVKLVDYKTGKPKSLGFIEGKTKDSTGDLKRQLVFYQLLLDLDFKLNLKVGEVELDFVAAPKLSQKSGRRRFKIQTEEVSQLKQLIKQTMAEIRNLKFPRTQDLSQCAKCDFRDHCWPEGIPQH